MNLAAAFFSGGVWMIASAIWQTLYRSSRVDPGKRVFTLLGIDIVPAMLMALVVGSLA